MRWITLRDKGFSREELTQLAETLRGIEELKNKLLKQLNGRVAVKWIDPLLSFGKANKFYDKLRNELDNEWCQQEGKDGHKTSPFYGKRTD